MFPRFLFCFVRKRRLCQNKNAAGHNIVALNTAPTATVAVFDDSIVHLLPSPGDVYGVVVHCTPSEDNALRCRCFANRPSMLLRIRHPLLLLLLVIILVLFEQLQRLFSKMHITSDLLWSRASTRPSRLTNQT